MATMKPQLTGSGWRKHGKTAPSSLNRGNGGREVSSRRQSWRKMTIHDRPLLCTICTYTHADTITPRLMNLGIGLKPLFSLPPSLSPFN